MEKYDKNILHLSGEFAKICGIPKSTLHYYVSIGLIKPFLTTDTNYNYYATNQAYTIHLISILQKAGCSLDEIQIYLHHKSDINAYRSMLEEKEQSLIEARNELDHTISMLRTINYFASFSTEHDFSEPKIRTSTKSFLLYTTRPAAPVLAGTKEYAIAYMNHMKQCDLLDYALKYPIGRIMKERDFIMESYQYHYFFSLSKTSFYSNTPEICIPAGNFVSLSFQGNASSIADAYQKVLQYIADHHLDIIGDSFEINLADPLAIEKENPHNVLLSIPIA